MKRQREQAEIFAHIETFRIKSIWTNRLSPRKSLVTIKPQNFMKKLSISLLILVSALTLVTGCSWSVGGGQKSATIQPTTGQQLIDLQRAKDSGAISDAEYQTQKAKLLAK
jgi:Trk-type K+ transport system membrane component